MSVTNRALASACLLSLVAAGGLYGCAGPGAAQPGLEDTALPAGEDSADLAQDLTNPLADLITLPVQVNFDEDVGPNDRGSRVRTNVQPVIPFELNEEWNLITRTIVPIVSQEQIFPGAGSQSGLGDINLTLFASPKLPTEDGWIWGAGPVILLPTATDDLLGTEKWGLGPSAVALTMRGPWTMGLLGNHIWSVAGDSNRKDINSTFVQPFAAYTWPSAWTVAVQSETTYDWEASEWSIPVNAAITKLAWFGPLPVSLQAGVGYWLDAPPAGPDGFRYRLQVNFVLPKW